MCYRISTSKGQSGSPVFIVKDGLAYVVGIHNGTVSGNNHHRHNFESNRAVYITHEVIKFIIECEEKMIKKPSNIIEANVAKRMVGGQKSIEKYQ